jgi:hypothetical protein
MLQIWAKFTNWRYFNCFIQLLTFFILILLTFAARASFSSVLCEVSQTGFLDVEAWFIGKYLSGSFRENTLQTRDIARDENKSPL